MKQPTLGIYQFIRNATKYDYPFEESILSALPVADEIVICECNSDDNTLERVKALQERHPSKIRVIYSDWVKDFKQLSLLGNRCIPALSTEWAWQLQADEVIHEDSYSEILKILRETPSTTNVIKVNYFHFLANYETEFDFMYRELRRIARKGTNWYLTGDACELDKLRGFVTSTEVVNSDIQVYHYGKVHEGKVGFQKEWDFQQLFKEIGFPDPKMLEMKEKFGEEYCDYLYLFESAIKEGKVRKFEGKHPAVMYDRIQRFKDGGWEQFISRMKENTK